jgi:hypothetical protein
MKVVGSVGKIVLERKVDGASKLAGESVRFIHDVVVRSVPYLLFLVYFVVKDAWALHCVGVTALPWIGLVKG